MRWTERQQALLDGMGLRLWAPAAGAAAPGQAALPAAQVRPAIAGLAPPPAPPVSAQPGPGPRVSTSPPWPPGDAVQVPDMPAPPAQPTPPAPPAPPAQPAQPAQPAASGANPMAAAGAHPVALLDWPALREAVAGCRACTLCDTRRQTVFGVGHRQAHCMVVGEAPGEQEDQQGEPFVGAAGQLLDRMLLALGLGRGEGPPAQQVFIANALKCRPPRNRNPLPDELAACRPFLERQVALVQPRVIIAMGRFAVQSLLGSSEPIGKLRGRVHQWQGRPLVVTYHPAYLLRQPADKARAWQDLCLAAQFLEPAAVAAG